MLYHPNSSLLVAWNFLLTQQIQTPARSQSLSQHLWEEHRNLSLIHECEEEML